MNNHKIPFLFLLVILLFFSCKKEGEINPQFDDFVKSIQSPICKNLVFSIDQDGYKLSHSWNRIDDAKTEGNNFIRYLLVRSTSSIPDDFSLQTGFDNETTVAYIEDINTTSWDEYLVDRNPTLYYRVFAQLYESYIPSNEIIISNDVHTFQIEGVDRIYHNPNAGVLYAISIDSIIAYDYKQKSVLASISHPFISSSLSFTHGITNNEDEVYFANRNSSEILILDAHTLEQKSTLNVGQEGINNITFNNDGSLFALIDDDFGTILFLDRATGEILGQANPTTFNDDAFYLDIKPVPNSPNSVYSFYGTGIRRGAYHQSNFSSSGEFLSNGPVIEVNSGIIKDVIISKSEGFLIPNFTGTIYDKDGTILNSIEPVDQNLGEYDNFALSPDETLLFGLKNFPSSNISYRNSFEVFSFPDLELINEFKLDPETQVFSDDEMVILVSRFNPSGSNNTDFISIREFGL